jgi:hypothetical protein
VAVISLIVGVGLAICGDAVVWAVLVMVSPPSVLLSALSESRRSGHNALVAVTGPEYRIGTGSDKPYS